MKYYSKGLCLFLFLILFTLACGESSSKKKKDTFVEPEQGDLHWNQYSFDENDFFSIPYPSDDRIKDYKLNLGQFPKKVPNGSFADRILKDFVADFHGFSGQGSIYFNFDKPLKPKSWQPIIRLTKKDFNPKRPPAFFLYSLSKEKFYPIYWRYYFEEDKFFKANTVAFTPLLGHGLALDSDFIAVVSVYALDGAGKKLKAIDQTKLSSGLKDALLKLEKSIDIKPELIAAATHFKTGDFSIMYKELSKSALNETVKLNKIEKYKVRSNYDQLKGEAEIPIYQTGNSPYNKTGEGRLVKKDGKYLVQEMRKVRLAVTIPHKVKPALGYPVVIYAHGTGGSYTSFVSGGTAWKLSNLGFAVISTDQVSHGTRIPKDIDPSLAFFNVNNYRTARSNVLQGSIDLLSLEKLIPELAKKLPLDPSQIYFMGHSQGGLTSPPYLAFDSKVRAAVLSAAGGGIKHSLLLKTEPIIIKDVVLLALGLSKNSTSAKQLDEFHPILSFVQNFLDDSDPLNFAALYKERPMHYLVTEGIGDSYTPNLNTDGFALNMEASFLGPLISPVPAKAGLAPDLLKLPFKGEKDKYYRLFKQYPKNPKYDGHFAAFHDSNAIENWQSFLLSIYETGIPEVRDSK